MQLRPGALQGVLHQVICCGPVAYKRAGVASQPRDQIDQTLGFVHGRNRGGEGPIPRYFGSPGNGGGGRKKGPPPAKARGGGWRGVFSSPPPLGPAGTSPAPVHPRARKTLYHASPL